MSRLTCRYGDCNEAATGGDQLQIDAGRMLTVNYCERHKRAWDTLPDIVNNGAGKCVMSGCAAPIFAVHCCRRHYDQTKPWKMATALRFSATMPEVQMSVLTPLPVPAAQPPPTPEAPDAVVPTLEAAFEAATKVWAALSQEERDKCLVAASMATISTGDGAFAPPIEPQEAAGEGAHPVVAHIAAITKIERDLRTRRDAVATRLISAGFEMEYGTLQTTAYRKGDLLVSLPMDDRGLSLSEFERRVVGAEVVAPTAIISALLKDAAEMATAEPPSPEVVADFLLTPKRAAEVTEADSEPPATVEEFLRGLESGDGEPSVGDVDDAPLFVGSTDSAPTQPMSPDLAAIAARGQQPTAPGPTLAEVQAELARERLHLRKRADEAKERLHLRTLADEAKAELAAIAALLDPEDAPAYDSDDQPIPLPVRVQTALMPHSESLLVRGLRAEKDAFWGIINDIDWIAHHCGSYGATDALADRVLRLLPIERQRAILELKRSEANIEVLRINARFLNPPPPERVAELVAKVATLDARIAALDAG
jgi:hypothetical protein